jgi:hypothetical protein
MAKPSASLDRIALAHMVLSNPVEAHEVVFAHRHSAKSSQAHRELIKRYHSPLPYVIGMCHRGFAKSTLLEETAAIKAATGQVEHVLIIGDTEPRALERLASIRQEFEDNKYLNYLCGDLQGDNWGGRRITLSNGCAFSALGQGQSLRGIKQGSHRPDFCIIDDLENEESVDTKEARRKVWNWFWKVLKPALHIKDFRIRMAATPLHPESCAMRLSQMKEVDTLFVPVEFIDYFGERQSSWPDMFSLDAIDELRRTYINAGQLDKFMSEYMVQAVDPGTRLFSKEMFKFDPALARSWHPTYAVIDPARSVKSSSSTTGVAVASWVGRKLVIWEARGPRILPSEIIDECFRIEEKYNPIAIGVEKDGLEQFIMEPLRHEQINRSSLLPIRELKAPKGKTEFIGRLQPLFTNGDIVFAGTSGQFDDAVAQFLAFPTGEIDIPNALAYLLHPSLRLGTPVYEDTSGHHIDDEIYKRPAPYTLAINVGSYGVAAALFQYCDRILLIHKDWASEGTSFQLTGIIEEARLYANKQVQVICPSHHWDARNSFGLLAAVRGTADLRKGGALDTGREVLRELLRGEIKSEPRLKIGPDAVWTRKAMLGGYVWAQGATGPKENIYSTLMNALESAIAPISYQSVSSQPVAFTPDGVRYETAEPHRVAGY